MDGKHFVDCMTHGDASVWEELLPELRRIVLGACHNMRVFNELRDDIVQDVAIKVFTDWQNYKQQSQLNTWIYAIARNRCIDVLRARTVRGDDRVGPSGDSEETISDARDGYRPSLEQTLCIEQMISALESQGDAREGAMRMIEVVRWCVENDGTTEELARFLKTTSSAATTRKSAIFKRVRELCEHFCGNRDCLMHPTAA